MRLREFIDKLEAEGELLRIKAKVDTRFEMCEIVDRISKCEGGGKAVLFENNGTALRVVRIYWHIGVSIFNCFFSTLFH